MEKEFETNKTQEEREDMTNVLASRCENFLMDGPLRPIDGVHTRNALGAGFFFTNRCQFIYICQVQSRFFSLAIGQLICVSHLGWIYD